MVGGRGRLGGPGRMTRGTRSSFSWNWTMPFTVECTTIVRIAEAFQDPCPSPVLTIRIRKLEVGRIPLSHNWPSGVIRMGSPV